MLPVTDAELPHALIQLNKHSEGPIFLQSNLRKYGLAGESPKSVYLWRNESWTGFVGVTVAGVATPQMRDASAHDWQTLRQAMTGINVSGIIGEYRQSTRLQDALGLTDAARTLDDDEPAFSLDLADLRIPDCDGLHLASPRSVDHQLLLNWRIAYRCETLGDTPETAARISVAEVREMQQNRSHYLLWKDDSPLSLAGVNAHISGVVQIGGVYTPVDLRRNGYARRAVALLLDKKRREGVRQAFLFAASDQAARAYTALGFQPNGRVRMIFYRDAT